MSRPRPEPGVEYAAEGPTPEFRAASRREACRSLAAWAGVEVRQAARWLEDGTAAEEIRSRTAVTGPQARRVLERRYAGP